VAGRTFNELPEEQRRALTLKYPNGGRFRHPPLVSTHNPDFVDDRNKAVCQEYLSGSTKEEIIERHKICMRTIEKILRNNGIETRKEKQKSRRETIIEMLQKKVKKEEIAKALGISRQRLYQIMQEEGLK
jgi:DNA invertase Pin-like site-specific DNA recombinase